MANHILLSCTWKDTVTFNYIQQPEFAYLSEIPSALDQGKVQWDFLAHHYGTGKAGGVYIGFEDDGSPSKVNNPPWQEIVVGSLDPQVHRNDNAVRIDITGIKLDSYTIQAQRRRKVASNSVIENAIQGLLIRDGKFLLGIRGGVDQPGTLNVLPGGTVAYRVSYAANPFVDSFHAEAYEEGGVDIRDTHLLGIFNQDGAHINRQWVYAGYPKADLEEIIDHHRRGYEFYHRIRDQHGDEAKARQALQESTYPSDAWENTRLIALEYNPATLLGLLREGKHSLSDGSSVACIGTLPASLYLLGVAEFGDKFKREAEEFPAVRERVRFTR